MWFGHDGILQQNLLGGHTSQMEIIHCIINSSGLSAYDIESRKNYLIDEAYAVFINKYISIYTDGKMGDSYSWYVYDKDGKASIQLKKPYNIMYIVINIHPNDIGIGMMSFSDISVKMGFVDESGKWFMRRGEMADNLSTTNFNGAALIMNRLMREVGASIPSDGTGHPLFNLDMIIQRGDTLAPQNYHIDGLLPDQINSPPSINRN